MTREEYIIAIIAFLKKHFSFFFIAGLMGNIWKETANTFDPKTVQRGKGYTNEEYIRKVYSGEVDFINDRVGFGLFQLTTPGRKQRFWDFCQERGYNIGDLLAQLEYFVYEITLTGYANVRKAIKENWGIDEVARVICCEYEIPESVIKGGEIKEDAIRKRTDCAYLIYNEFLRKEKAKSMAKIKICLDAGHYGKANQSPVVKSYWESDWTWKFTNYEKEELESFGLFEVVLTRTNKDKDLSLDKRGKMMKGCKVGISNHSNACSDESVDHPSIIIPRPDGETLVTECSVLANRIGANIKKEMGCKQDAKVYSKDAGYDRNANKKNGDDEYYGVMNGAQSTDCPMYMIVEHGFHTNTANAKWLLDDANTRRLAKSEARVIADFLIDMYDLPQTGTETTDEKHDFDQPINTYTYIVQKGDSINAIAKKFNVSPDEIVALNNISNRNLITVGQKLLIPLEGKIKYYIVKKGDTLSGIAKRLGLNGYKELAKVNNLSWPYLITPGQSLLIP